MNRLNGVLLLLLAMLPPVAGADNELSDYTQTRIAQIHDIDLASRTAVMSGYRYSFAGNNGYDQPPVRLYGSNFGSLEMLAVGMKVRVTYRLAKQARVVVDLQQVADTARLGVPDVDE